MAILDYELYIQSLSMLYLQATFKGWMDIMYAAVDSRNVSILYILSLFTILIRH